MDLALAQTVARLPVSSTTDVEGNVRWFWDDFLPSWIDHAHDRETGGFSDFLDGSGRVPAQAQKTILAQARLLFTFSHLALISDAPAYRKGAEIAHAAIDQFLKLNGLYRRAVGPDGELLADQADRQARSYDQTFVILGLSTWAKLTGCTKAPETIEHLWAAVQTNLIDPATGMLIDHDDVLNPAAPDAPNPSQNPHMHMYEAALQAYEMGMGSVWLERAKDMRAKGLQYFFDTRSGTIAEFIKPDLTPLSGKDGQWREIGHQCEWAWLLQREVDLGGDPDMAAISARLWSFAHKNGFCPDGLMGGAAYDAVAADLSWAEHKFLLWPQTEAIKALAMQVRAGDDLFAQRAKALCSTMFDRYFAGQAAYINQVDLDGNVIWDEALSRLLYHIVLALTEGARFGLWSNP